MLKKKKQPKNVVQDQTWWGIHLSAFNYYFKCCINCRSVGIFSLSASVHRYLFSSWLLTFRSSFSTWSPVVFLNCKWLKEQPKLTNRTKLKSFSWEGGNYKRTPGWTLCGVLLGRQKLALGCLSGGGEKTSSRCSLNSNLKGLSISSQTRHISAWTPLRIDLWDNFPGMWALGRLQSQGWLTSRCVSRSVSRQVRDVVCASLALKH